MAEQGRKPGEVGSVLEASHTIELARLISAELDRYRDRTRATVIAYAGACAALLGAVVGLRKIQWPPEGTEASGWYALLLATVAMAAIGLFSIRVIAVTGARAHYAKTLRQHLVAELGAREGIAIELSLDAVGRRIGGDGDVVEWLAKERSRTNVWWPRSRGLLLVYALAIVALWVGTVGVAIIVLLS